MNPNKSYDDYVEMLARRGLEAGASTRDVAEASIIDTYDVDEEKALLYSLEPFADDPAEDTRLWPKDVITGSNRQLIPKQPNDLRELAVELLVIDTYQGRMAIENDTARPWGEA